MRRYCAWCAKGHFPPRLIIRVLGGDEWAWRNGQSYGTILVDLEQHIPIAELREMTMIELCHEDEQREPEVSFDVEA